MQKYRKSPSQIAVHYCWMSLEFSCCSWAQSCDKCPTSSLWNLALTDWTSCRRLPDYSLLTKNEILHISSKVRVYHTVQCKVATKINCLQHITQNKDDGKCIGRCLIWQEASVEPHYFPRTHTNEKQHCDSHKCHADPLQFDDDPWICLMVLML